MFGIRQIMRPMSGYGPASFFGKSDAGLVADHGQLQLVMSGASAEQSACRNISPRCRFPRPPESSLQAVRLVAAQAAWTSDLRDALTSLSPRAVLGQLLVARQAWEVRRRLRDASRQLRDPWVHERHERLRRGRQLGSRFSLYRKGGPSGIDPAAAEMVFTLCSLRRYWWRERGTES